MAANQFNFATMAAALESNTEEGVEFQDKALTWDTAEDVKDVVAALDSKKKVHFLKLDGNTLGVEAAQAIGKALESHPEFRKALWKNMFTRRLKSEIPLALKHLGAGMITAGAKLTVLDLSDNALGPNGMTGLEDFLRSSVCYTLQELHLNNCGLGPEGGRMLSEALLDLHANAKEAGSPLQLRVLVAGRNRLENAGAKAMSNVFKTLKTFEEITMPQNSIYHQGVAHLAEGFKLNPHLRVLNMNDNTLTPKGAGKIAEVFAETPLLREINFGDCLIKTDGAYQLAEALEKNHLELETVELGFNDINYDGGLTLVGAMKNKPKLKFLNLDGNYFGHEGRTQIQEEMAKCLNPAALQSLDEDASEDEDGGQDDDAEGEEEEDEDGEYSTECADDQETDDQDNETDEVDEDDDAEEDEEEDENKAEETAYVTTNAFTTALFNDSVTSTKEDAPAASDTFVNNNTVSSTTDTTESTTIITEPTATESTTITATESTSTITATESTSTITDTSCTPEQFCLSQSPLTLQQFDSLKDGDKLQALKDIIDQFEDDNHLLLLVFTTLKCAHLSKESKAALDLAVSLYQATFEYAIKTQQETRVLEYLLMQLGLLRSEEAFKSEYDIKSCRYALREALTKQQFANENVKNTFNVFLEKLDA